MKRYYILMLLLVSMVGTVYAQVETHYYKKGNPDVSIKRSVRSNQKVNRMPSFDLAALQREDAKKDSMGGFFRFGKGFDVGYTLADGQWENVEGGRLWTMTFASANALSLNFVFNDFQLPEGAELYVENEDKTVAYGPVTKEATTENGVFLTDIIPGEQATISLFEPSECEGQSSLTIKRVVHGYRSIQASTITRKATLKSSTTYDLNISCYSDYEKEADGIGAILTSNGTALGSGALMMSTDFSFKPYFLTVYDFVDQNEDGIITDEERNAAENSAFKFLYKKVECGNTETTVSFTYNHAQIRATWMDTMYALVELNGSVRNNPYLTWLGWNYESIAPGSATCLYYPSYNPEGIFFDYSVEAFDSPHYILGNKGWVGNVDYGALRQSAIGAPLLDQNNRVIGQICGTAISSDDFTPDFYIAGKLSYSWFGDETSATKLQHWLDPNLRGWTIMNSYRSMIIKGVSKIVSSAIYHVSNLPSGMTVTWSISDNYYNQYCLQQDPTTNSCTITRNTSYDITRETLTATIKQGGTNICTITKTISTGNGFEGTYYNGQATVPVDPLSSLYVLPGTLVTITSPNLVGATVTQIGGNATPTSWSHNTSNGILQVGMPSTTGSAVVVRVIDPAGGYYFLTIMTSEDSISVLSVSQTNNQLEVTLDQQDRVEAPNTSESRMQKWTLETYNASTAHKVYSTTVEGSKYTIDTTDWKPGVYIVKASDGSREWSEKVVVK